MKQGGGVEEGGRMRGKMGTGMRVEIGSDHRGYALKARLSAWLRERGWEVNDHGCESAESCDYPEFAFRVARAVAASPGSLGVLMCGSGIGMSIAANKVRGVRAALCLTPRMATLSRQHNDANVLALGADLLSEAENLAILSAWLEAKFEGGRHERRVRMLAGGPSAGGVEPSAPDGGRAPATGARPSGEEASMDPDCVFCRIVAGGIPADKVFEDEAVLAFRDIHPSAPAHVLLIPKAHIASLNELAPQHDALLGRLIRAAKEVAAREGIAGKGYRLVGNCGREAGQEVMHVHFHLLGGRPLGWPPG